MKKVIIVGGGISGLSVAWYLRNLPVEISLLERKSVLGGVMQSVRKGAFLWEQGPEVFKWSRCPELICLIQELGLSQDLIFSSEEAKRRYLYVRGALRPLFSTLLPLLPALAKDLWAKKGSGEEESIYDCISRRYSRQVAIELFDPITLGIYAGDIRKLSMKASFPSLYGWQQDYGSFYKGFFKSKKKDSRLFSLKGGNGSLIAALQKQIRATVSTSSEVIAITPYADQVIVATNHRAFSCDHLIIATSSREAGRLLHIPLLQEITRASIVSVHLGYDQDLWRKKGFGYLVPTSENDPVLGALWNSSIFPQRTRVTSFTFLLGGIHHPEIIGFSEEACISLAIRAAKKHMGIIKEPVEKQVAFHPHFLPQLEVGHSLRMDRVQKMLPARISCVGNYWEGVSVEDCLKRAKNFSSSLTRLCTFC